MAEFHVTTAFELAGFRIQRTVGVVRGILVRSRSLVGTFAASLQTIMGGNITMWTEMCEHARRDAHDVMVANARALGANGIIGMRYDSTEVAPGVTEVLAYGTAVVLEPGEGSTGRFD